MTKPFQHWNVLPHGRLSKIGAETESPRRILVSHGEPIDADPRQTLRDLAGTLT